MWISECFPAEGNLDPDIIAEYELDDDWTLTVMVDDQGKCRVEGEEGFGDSEDPMHVGGYEVLRGDACRFVDRVRHLWKSPAWLVDPDAINGATRHVLSALDEYPEKRAEVATEENAGLLRDWFGQDVCEYVHSPEGTWGCLYDEILDNVLDTVDWEHVFQCLKDWPATRVRMGWSLAATDKETSHEDQ